MKLTVSTLACPAWTLDQIIENCRAAGLNGVDFRGIGPEIDITQLPEFNDKLDQTLERLHAAGLEMPCLNTSGKLMALPDQWDAVLAEIERYSRLAEKTHTPLLRIFGGQIPKGLTREEAATLGSRHLRQLTKIARKFKTKIAIETHDDWITVPLLKQLIAELSPEEVAVLWDIQHPVSVGEPPKETVAGLGAYIQHVHIKDMRLTPERGPNVLLGDGQLPIKECVHLLREIQFTGWYSLETEKRWQSSAADPEQSVPQFAKYMRSI